MTKELLIASSAHETKVALLEDDQLVEVYFQRDTDVGLAGGIYKGRVNRVLPGMQSAFVNIGLERDAFLYVSDFFEDSEEYEPVLERERHHTPPAANPSTAPDVNESEATADSAQAAAFESRSGGEATSGTAADAQSQESSTENEGESAKPAVTADPGEPGNSGRHEHRRRFGMGRSRRGRRFQRTPEDRPPRENSGAESQGIGLLPGESLAKYGRAPEDLSSSGTNSWTEEDPPDATAPQDSSDSPDSGAEPVQTIDSGADSEFPSADELTSETRQAEPAAPIELPSIANREAEDLSNPETTEPADLSADNEAAEISESAAQVEHSASEPGSTSGEPVPEAVGRSYTLRDTERRQHLVPRRRGRRGRGRFRSQHGARPKSPQQSGSEPSADSHPAAISELLKEGQEILVQIAKEPLGAKGARITSHIALPGRYLVYMPTITHIGVSRKIGSEEERLRLRSIILKHKGSLMGGVIVRTAGAGRTEEEIRSDLEFLSQLWNEIRSKAERAKAPALLHRDLTLVERILRDLLSPEFKSIRIDSESEYEHVLQFVQRFQPPIVGHVKLYTRETPLFEESGVQNEIDKALRPKVWLKSGGYIVINQTEALVAIDVNTGKYVGKTNRLEDTIVKTNIDAVKEIVRQIRLRDLGGIIVIDFIDMDDRRNRAKVVQALEDALRLDRAPTKILSFNEFGLVALTRKRVKQSLERTLCEPCVHCAGSGWIKSVPTVTNEIYSEARKMAPEIDGKVINLRVNPAVAAALRSRGGILVNEIEAATGKEVVIKSDPEAHQERFEIF